MVDGKTWYVKKYEIENDDCYLNFVFNTGNNGSPQTVDVMHVSTDKYFIISTQKSGSKHLVNEYTPGLFDPCDVNRDGNITATDITAIYNYLLRNDTTYIDTSDCNNDGVITSSDITVIYNRLLKE